MPIHKNIWPLLEPWLGNHRRSFCWRLTDFPRRFYTTLLSEYMLQQTTAATVQKRFSVFVEAFPSLEALAAAPLHEVMVLWQGLGYYKRARSLHALAQNLVAHQSAQNPRPPSLLLTNDDDLLKIRQQDLDLLHDIHHRNVCAPGIGPYTRAALNAFVGLKPVVALDANIKRIVTRLYNIEQKNAEQCVLDAQHRPCILAKTSINIVRYAPYILPDSGAYSVHYAQLNEGLMDLGAMVCKAKNPTCEVCPLNTLCDTYHAKTNAAAADDNPPQQSLSKNKSSNKRSEWWHLLCITHQKNGYMYKQILHQTREMLLRDLWIYPFITESCAPDTPSSLFEKFTVTPSFTHIFSHIKAHIYVHYIEADQLHRGPYQDIYQHMLTQRKISLTSLADESYLREYALEHRHEDNVAHNKMLYLATPSQITYMPLSSLMRKVLQMQKV